LKKEYSIRRETSDQTLDQPEDEDKEEPRQSCQDALRFLGPSILRRAFTAPRHWAHPLRFCKLRGLSVLTGRGPNTFFMETSDGLWTWKTVLAQLRRAVANPRLRRRIASRDRMECGDGFK